MQTAYDLLLAFVANAVVQLRRGWPLAAFIVGVPLILSETWRPAGALVLFGLFAFYLVTSIRLHLAWMQGR